MIHDIKYSQSILVNVFSRELKYSLLSHRQNPLDNKNILCIMTGNKIIGQRILAYQLGPKIYNRLHHDNKFVIHKYSTQKQDENLDSEAARI